MNPHTFRVLEFPKVLDGLAECCSTDLAREFARNLKPLKDPKEISGLLDEVDEVMKSGITIERQQPFAANYLRAKTERLDSFLTSGDLDKLRSFLSSIMLTKKRLANRLLSHIVDRLGDYGGLISDINRVFYEDGSMREDASPRLRHLKKSIEESRHKILKTLETTVQEYEGILSDRTVTLREGRYVVLLKAAHRGGIKGVVHDFSSSGQTVFIEPLVSLDDQNRLGELSVEEQEEIVNILMALTEAVRRRIDEIEDDIMRIGRLDLIFGKALFAQRMGAKRAQISEDGRLRILLARHPLLLFLRSDGIVPLDLELARDTRIVVISGPNAGGKTVALKTIGLMILMNQAGLFVPADEGTALPIFDEIFADIGDEQSIEESRSTFSAHLAVINEARKRGSEDTLILFDEFLSQTSPDEGAALACALLEEFRELGCRLFVTTHNERIKMFVQSQPLMKNAGMEFRGKPTYRLMLDLPQASNALNVAREMGVGEKLIKRAESFLDPVVYSFNQLLEKLAIESTRAKELSTEFESLKDEYETKVSGFKEYSRREKEKMRDDFESFMEKKSREIVALVKEIRASQASKSAVKKAQDAIETSRCSVSAKQEPYFPGSEKRFCARAIRVRERSWKRRARNTWSRLAR